MKKTFAATGAVFALMGLFAPAQAYEAGGHQADHREHGRFHNYAGEDHADAHEYGFYSRSHHRRYHRALREQHHGFHDDHPYTRHDHDRRPRYRLRWWN